MRVTLGCTLSFCLYFVAKADAYEVSSSWAVSDEDTPPPIA